MHGWASSTITFTVPYKCAQRQKTIETMEVNCLARGEECHARAVDRDTFLIPSYVGCRLHTAGSF